MSEQKDTIEGMRHEKRDVSPRLVAAIVAGLAALTLGAALLMWGSFVYLQRRSERVEESSWPLREERTLPPDPRLQVAPERDLQQIRRQEEERVTTYGWIDREAGVVRIPVERAMEVLLRRGLPVRPEAAAGGRDRSSERQGTERRELEGGRP